MKNKLLSKYMRKTYDIIDLNYILLYRLKLGN